MDSLYRRLTLEVADMLRAGKLCVHDAQWISWLSPASQAAAAEKCTNPTFAVAPMDNPKSCIYVPKSGSSPFFL